MSEHPHATLVRRALQGLRSGDISAFAELAAPDLVWHFPGRSGQLAGTHQGFDQVVSFLARVVDLSGGTFELDLIDVVANHRRAIALFRGRAHRGGRQLDNPTCLSMRFRDEQIVEIWEFVWDLYEVDEFWAPIPTKGGE
jgi:ketosteroid isomerase-like protein